MTAIWVSKLKQGKAESLWKKGAHVQDPWK